MLSEKQKMLRGDLYNASDETLAEERRACRLLLQQLNQPGNDDQQTRRRLLLQLIPGQGTDLWLEPPFYCDYGYNITVGDKVYFNFNCVILDVMKVIIGSNVLVGPAVQIYTALHPMDSRERALGTEYAKPVTVGSDVWIGGGVIICPGVTIGNGCVIGAGSVVTKNIADGIFAAGNPCRPIRQL